jgi:hypothetical protein
MKSKKDFIQLKDEKFIYAGKTYTQQRFISKDLKIYITCDNGHDYALLYVANNTGKGDLYPDPSHIYHDGNRYAHPIWTVEEMINKVNEIGLIPEHKFIVHPSQYKYKRDNFVSNKITN